jgi:hypothetical protein
MLKIIGIVILIIFICFPAKSCLHSGPPYTNDKGQIVDENGVIVIPHLTYLMSSDSDTAICRTLLDPAQLPMQSYNTQNGFDACVARCLTFTTRQVCSQFPRNSHFLATKPQLLQKMLHSCQDNINSFVERGITCKFLNCVP